MRLLIILTVVAAAGCGETEPYEKPVTPVQVAELRRQSIERPLRYSAAIEPGTRVDVAFRVGGYVTSIAALGGRLVQDGDSVTEGMVLASVRLADYDEKVNQARAQLAEARAARDAATAAVGRAEALFAARSLTRPELDQARSTLAAIDARIAGATALVSDAELARADTSIRAPMSGVILKRLVEVGALVGPGMPGFVIADTRTVKVVVGVADTLLASFPLGATETVRTDALPGRRFEGRVTKVSPTADPRSRLFDVEVTLANGDGALKPGMVAAVQVARVAGVTPPVGEALVLPLSAVVRPPGERDGYAVYVLREQDGVSTAQLRRVTLGELLGNDITVVDGLTGGERVIVQGATIVTDGDRVNPTR
jgi:multidrug efflux system membrane fusion protein